ncbi:FUSC family protein [Rhodoluna limnophila]|uniref:FUSC family protein n=1 Tax=Rhodoluna limnophila TaxID=232537 RepID=UPI00110707CD|nr:FUSC family protein [Rhodoluna limnophila]
MTIRAPKINWTLRTAVQRVLESLPPITQIVAAATTAYLFAYFVLGHQNPIFAVTVSIAALGFTRDARLRRVFETALGMVVGIALSEVFLLTLGKGAWQMAIVLFVALVSARFLSGTAAFSLTVGIQAMLVQIMPDPDGGAFVRSLDGLLGGVTALVFTAFIPRDPIGMASKDAGKLFAVFLDAVDALAAAVKNVDVKVVDAALVRVRRSQPLVDNWRMSLDSAVSISRISPLLRKHRGELSDQMRLMRGMDLATRNLRVVVRRVDFLIRDGVPRPYLADLFEQISAATAVLAKGLEGPDALEDAQKMFLDIIHQLDPKRFGIADQLREASVLLLLRPLLIDLLCASGMAEDAARAELPEV